MGEIDQSSERIDELMLRYEEIFVRLRKEQEAGRLSALSLGVIIRLIYNVARQLTKNQANVQDRIGDVMGGKMEELDIIKAVHEARKEEAEKRKQLESEIERLRKENEELKAAVAGLN